MEKKYIDTFIKKYNLAGAIEGAHWINDGGNLTTTAMTSDRKLFVQVILEKGASWFKDVEIGVQKTTKLKKMLDILGDNIVLTLDIDENDPTRVRQIIAEDADGKASINYVTSALSVLEPVPKMKTIPPFTVDIFLSDEFIDKFNTGFSALGDEATAFTLIMSKKKQKLDMVLGYKKNMGDKVTLEVATAPGKDTVKNPISFDAKLLKEIISANNEIKNPTLQISESGLASIAYDNDGFKSLYYMIKIDVED